MQELVAHTARINDQLARYGVKFGIYKNGTFNERLFPFDAIARVIDADDWALLERGLAQRVDALNAYRYTLRRQRDDGSWFYAERREQRWIDSFHTGFNLEAIRRALRLGALSEYREAYRAGVRFYANRFFQFDGRPNYYADREYLVDVHAPMEAIYFFASEPEYRELWRRVARWTNQNMLNRAQDGFYFRKTRFITIKTRYMRWSQAWAARAYAEATANANE